MSSRTSVFCDVPTCRKEIPAGAPYMHFVTKRIAPEYQVDVCSEACAKAAIESLAAIVQQKRLEWDVENDAKDAALRKARAENAKGESKP